MAKPGVGFARTRTGRLWKRIWGAAAIRRFPALIAGVLVLAIGHAHAAPEGSRYNADYFTNLPVTTHEGKTVPFYDGLIKGKKVVFTFIYTDCNDICPLTTSRIAKIRERLGDAVGRDVFLYSVTMDPQRDTPEVLKEYAEAFGAGGGWLFITGKPEHIKLIRWRLGERSRKLSEHRNDMMLGNDITGDWSRSSVYSDLAVAVTTIRRLDPNWEPEQPKTTVALPKGRGYRLDKQPGQALFRKACASCHSIGGGDRIGPDLKDIAKRREPKWLTEFLMAPDEMRAKKDPLTMAISQKYKGVKMPNLGLGENDISDLLNYIETMSRAADGQASAAKAAPAGRGPGG